MVVMVGSWFMSDQRMDVQREIKRIVKYLWYDEEAHYWESSSISDRRRHIFNSLRFLNDKFNCGCKEDKSYKETK